MRARKNRLAMRRNKATASSLRVAQNRANAFDQLFETFFRLMELFSSRSGEPVVLGFTIGFGERPFRGDPAALLHPVKRRIQRAFFHLQQIFGGSLDMEHDSVSVQASALGKGFQDEKIETALEVVSGHPLPLYILGYKPKPRSGGMSSTVDA